MRKLRKYKPRIRIFFEEQDVQIRKENGGSLFPAIRMRTSQHCTPKLSIVLNLFVERLSKISEVKFSNTMRRYATEQRKLPNSNGGSRRSTEKSI